MRRIGFLLYPGYEPMGFALASPFQVANRQAETPIYDIRMLSRHGGPVRTSLGYDFETEALGDDRYDLFIVGASVEEASGETVEFVKFAATRCRRMAATCHGAFVLAEAGLLDGRRAVTHWDRVAELRQRFPTIRVEEDRIFVADGMMWTSAGMTAGIDLALALIEEDLGLDATRAIARRLVVHHRRAGGQSQFSKLLDIEPESDRMQAVVAHIREHLADRLSVEDLAEVARLSPRQFNRVFLAEVGFTPAKAVENLRLEGARALLEDTSHTLAVIAQLTGFGDPDRMRRAFLRAYGQPPHIMRRLAHGHTVSDENS